MPPVGRTLTDLAQKAKGRQALRFQIELVPYYFDEIPQNVKQASFLWERGAKLQFTDPSPVDATDRSVFWGNTLLKQTATMYKENDAIHAKEYQFKVQSVSPVSDKRSTFAKTKIDLAKYCSCESSEPQEVYIPLKPRGTLRIGIQITWLRHSSPENDAMTEISGLSLGPSGTSSLLDDQDLTGFDSQQSKVYGLRQKQVVATPFQRRMTPPPSPKGAANERGFNALTVVAPTASTTNRRVGFQDVDLQDDQETPRMSPKPTRRPPTSTQDASSFHQPKGSSYVPPGSSSAADANRKQDLPSITSTERDKILSESYATLISSDSDEEGGMVASAKRWWSSNDKRKEMSYQSNQSRPRSAVVTPPASTDLELEILNKEDITSLRQLCKQTLRERDQEQLLRQQAERKARHLQSDCEALAMSKSMLVERLREAEDRLMTMRQEETMSALVQAKIKLAQADYTNLELQGHLSTERERVRVLKTKLTDMEAAYHATLDSLDRLKQEDDPGPAESTFIRWMR